MSYGSNANGTGTGPHQARSVGGVSYTYDNNGNLTTRTGTSITWNVDNQPTSITNGGVTETYQYDADGERVKRVANNVTTVYLSGLYEEDQETGTKRVLYTLNGQVVAQRTKTAIAEGVIYLHGDHLDSVSVVTDSTGSLLDQQDYDPWGQVRSGGTSRTTLNYTGQRRDGTGLLYYHARYYDPMLGRFLSADSVVPGAADGSIDGVALKPLTMDFHEPSFAFGDVICSFWNDRSTDEITILPRNRLAPHSTIG